MAYIKIAATGEMITPYVTLHKRQAVNLAVNTALDGTDYLVRFGSPTVSYDLEIGTTRAGRDLLFRAQDTLEELEIKVREGVFRGRIKEMSDFESTVPGWYTTTAKLSALSEVTEQ